VHSPERRSFATVNATATVTVTPPHQHTHAYGAPTHTHIQAWQAFQNRASEMARDGEKVGVGGDDDLPPILTPNSHAADELR